MPQNPYPPYQTFECAAGDARYRLWFEELAQPVGFENRFRMMRVAKSVDAGRTWTDLPMLLELKSRLVLWTSAQPLWPPEVPVQLGCDPHTVWFEYVDPVDEGPRWGRMPSAWRASFLPRKEKWTIAWLSYL